MVARVQAQGESAQGGRTGGRSANSAALAGRSDSGVKIMAGVEATRLGARARGESAQGSRTGARSADSALVGRSADSGVKVMADVNVARARGEAGQGASLRSICRFSAIWRARIAEALAQRASRKRSTTTAKLLHKTLS